MRTVTLQEKFWSEEFGREYIDRNPVVPETRVDFFATILSRTFGVQSVCEFGANKGHNLEAIHQLSSNYELTGVEIYSGAYELMQQNPFIQAVHSSIQDFEPNRLFDLTFTCGVLIHINPDDLPGVYKKLYDYSSRYVLINEYFNPSPVEVKYHNQAEKLFKRDFAGEFIDTVGSSNVRVIDYGFLWKRMSPSWDDTTYLLLEKTNLSL